MSRRPRIVVCGGGAGGLELATRLARHRDLDVVLVDREETHLWKPLLHELASGSLDPGSHEVSFLALARWHGFTFSQGPLVGLDRRQRQVVIGAVTDRDGSVIIPERRLGYDNLVIAIGGVTNDFGVPGSSRGAARLMGRGAGEHQPMDRRRHAAAHQAALKPHRLPNFLLRAAAEPTALRMVKPIGGMRRFSRRDCLSAMF